MGALFCGPHSSWAPPSPARRPPRRCNQATAPGPKTGIGETALAPPSPGPALARPFAKNRRDGARQISIAVVVSAIGLLAIHHPLGKVVVVVASSVAIYWGLGYRHLDE